MLKISKAISAKQAKNYYRNELSAKPEISASKFSVENSLEPNPSAYSDGVWRGKLAEEMHLTGEIKTAEFERLCEGLHPQTGEELVRRSPVKTYANRFGKEITTMERRACWDATFSAPKSVSLAAIAGGDERILEAHRASVHLSVSELEKYTEARMGGNKAAERTGKFVSALFEHQTARPDYLFGYSAPQLHTHAVVFNLTETADGVFKPVQPLELYKTQKYATAVYRIELADRLQKLGYQIEIDPKTKAPEIKGFSSEYLKENSLRSQELNTLTDAVKLRFAADGKTVASDAGIKQVPAWQSRAEKSFDVEAMHSRALELEVKYDFQAQRIYNQSLQNVSYQYDAAAEQRQAKAAIDFAKEITSPPAILQKDLLTNSFSSPGQDFLIKANSRQFLTEALETGTGKTNFATIQNEYNARTVNGEFTGLIKDENESSLFRTPPHNMKENNLSKEKGNNLDHPANTQTSFDRPNKETESNREIEKFSMDNLENAVRQQVTAENEIAQSLEFLLAI